MISFMGNVAWGMISGTPSSCSRGMRACVYAQLNDEWARIADTPTARAALAAWSAREPALVGFLSPAEVVTRHKEAGPAGGVQAALLRLAEDGLAARTLVQMLLPRLRAEAEARRMGHGWYLSGADATTELVGHLWELIALGVGADCSDPGRRLVDRAVMVVRTELRARRREAARSAEFSEASAPPVELHDARTTAERLSAVLADSHRAGRLGRRDARLLLAVASGLDVRSAGAAVGLSGPFAAYHQFRRATVAARCCA